MGGLPLDPVLAAFYARWSRASFATDVAGVVLAGNDDSEYNLESENSWWRQNHQQRIPLPIFIFCGEPLLAHSYGTLPTLADTQGRQPVVHVNTYEFDGPLILPVASDVDHFFHTYSLFLEELAATPEFKERREAMLGFPWDVPHVLARDERLVELMRAGRFEGLMSKEPSVRQWMERVVGSAAKA
jgi:hypothetical protein